MADHSGYIHGSEPVEQERLSLLNRLLNEASLAEMRLAGGERILDIGSGLGQLSRAMARVAGPKGCVVGIERDDEQRTTAIQLAGAANETDLVDFRSGEALDLCLRDDEWGTFDVAHARFVLEHVPDPQAVVSTMVRAVRPGGRIVLEDDDHDLLRLWPEARDVERLWRAYVRAYREIGNDPFVGRRLTGLLHQGGARPSRNRMLFFGGCHGELAFEAHVANFAGVLAGARDAVIATTHLDDAGFDAGIAALNDWAQLPDAALWYVTCWAEGVRDETCEVPRHTPAPITRVRATPAPRGPLTAMRFLADSARELSSTLDLGEVYAKIAERVKTLTDYDLFCVMLWNDDHQLLEHSYSLRRGLNLEQSGGFGLGYGISGCAARDRQPIRVADVRDDPRYVRFRHPEIEVRSELAVPLLCKDRLIGVVDVESTELDAFTEEHEHILSALAAHMAVALENARLYAALKEDEERLQDELATARKIQTHLLPRAIPLLPGIEIGTAYAPARELSGDFLDVLPYDAGRAALMVGDVAGKGTPAALYGSLAIGLTRGHILEHRYSPAEMIGYLDAQLRQLQINNRFLAILFAVIDGPARRLLFGNAGVPRPYLLRGGEVSRIGEHGIAVGSPQLRGRAAIGEVELEPGDVILLASDGLGDCMNPAGEFFRSPRIARLLAEHGDRPAQTIADELLESTSRFAETEAGITDDRTGIVVRVKR